MIDIIKVILRPCVSAVRKGHSYIGIKTAEKMISDEIKRSVITELDNIREKIETELGYVDVYDLISRRIKKLESDNKNE